jgi:hypothetical protein
VGAAKWIALGEAAQRLGLGIDDVLAMIRTGRLPGMLIDGVWHVRSCDVEAVASVARRRGPMLTNLESVRALLAIRGPAVARVNLEEYEVDPDILGVLDRSVCSRLSVFPVSRAGSSLILAMADPTDVNAMDEVKFHTGFDVEPVYAPKEAIDAAIDRQYDPLRGGGEGN